MRSMRQMFLEPSETASPEFLSLVEKIVIWDAVLHLESIVHAIECSEVTR